MVDILVRDLALFTGRPAFRERQVVGKPSIPNKDAVLGRIRGVLDRGILSNDGPLVREFETRVADELGVAHCIATSNATAAIELLLHALGLSGGVVVPSWTFIADPHAITRAGLRPQFCDVDARTHCVDPARVEAAVTADTTAILAVHLWGNGCDTTALDDIARRHGLALVYDAAHAFASRIDDRRIGGNGRAEVFSFHATKMIMSFEGGAITTDDDDLAELLRRGRNFGFAEPDRVVMVGTNAKMSEASAAMGLTSLESLTSLLRHNRSNHDTYREALRATPGVSVHQAVPNRDSNRHYVVVEIDPDEAGLTRDEILEVLRRENILARRYFRPGCHRQAPYRTIHAESGAALPVTEALSERVLVLPTGMTVSSDAAARIASVITTAVARATEVRRALREVDRGLVLSLGN